ncbi:hypothetical protein [Streptomyces sp. DSM 15324]|uniref:hypothetical protein n=1 Tax=Streptomyces sp. DSM 15324 TaxID=1739111 RepID=UPI00099E2FB1
MPLQLGAICVLSRRVSLRVLDEVVRACHGDWGIGGDREPGGGTRMWAVLPRAGAAGYLRTERTPWCSHSAPPDHPLSGPEQLP